ncbi:ABC transporter substrate-binding protein [Herbiconiux sp. 11R-BC]|uniref:ABC transporter substrate-binding protein n=1 Tax=Herbiconiux sp. 11R-BC TaxID=3111637 RepID=UPI003BFF9378
MPTLTSKPALLAVAAIGVAALLGGCSAAGGSSTSATSDGGLTKVTFALSYLPDISLNGLTYADKEGLFADAGLDVEILPWGASTPESLVGSGQADFGLATDIRTALIAMAAGSKITSLMALYQHEPYVLTTLASAGYTSPADLAGTTYGGFGSPMELAVVNDMIANAGGTTPAESVTLSVAAFDALSSGRVDSVLAFPGDNYAFEQSGTAITTFDPLDYGVPDGYASLVLGNDDFLQKNPDVAKKFMTALQAGYAAALADPTKADQDTLEEYAGEIDPAMAADTSAKQTTWLYPSADGIVGSQDVELWQKNADWMIKQGILAGADGAPLTTFDVTPFVSNEFLK